MAHNIWSRTPWKSSPCSNNGCAWSLTAAVIGADVFGERVLPGRDEFARECRQPASVHGSVNGAWSEKAPHIHTALGREGAAMKKMLDDIIDKCSGLVNRI